MMAAAIQGMALSLSGIIENGDQEKQQLLQDSGFDLLPTFLSMLVVLAAVVALIVGLSWVLKRIAGPGLAGRRASLINLIATFPLGEKRFLAIIKVGRRHLLLGVAAESIEVLTELSEEDVAEEDLPVSDDDGKSFKSVFQRFLGRNTEGGMDGR